MAKPKAASSKSMKELVSKSKGEAEPITKDPAPESGTKSIVDPKYRDRYKTPDWLAEQIGSVASTKKTVKRSETKEVDGEATKVTKEVEVDGPINVDALFALAEENGLGERVKKYNDQKEAHGFPGRFRMTLRNMLQARVKKAHGMYVNGKWVKADPEWLAAKGAPAEPTLTRAGEKIAVKKAKAEEKAEAVEA